MSAEDDKIKPDEPIETTPQAKKDKTAKTDKESGSVDHPEEATGGLGDSERVMADDGLAGQPGKLKRFFTGYWHRKKWTLPLTSLIIIGIVLALPASRYPLLALGIKRQYEVVIQDSKTHTPVSGARITLDGQTRTTDSAGRTFFKAKVGKRIVSVSKKYYKGFSERIFVGVNVSHNSSKVELQAVGRQVPITIINSISRYPLANAEIKVLDTQAKTDAHGVATIVLPTGSPTLPAIVTASGYNDLNTRVEVTSTAVVANTFRLTPTGRVYFLSNLSGDIDVVSTNLDGSDRQTVLAGSGNEDPNNTVLLASQDWKYLALLSKRSDGKNAQLYLINTSNNKLTTMDSTGAIFTPVGWDGHSFVYQADINNVPSWKSGGSLLKSYNAETGNDVTLDQTTASGTSQAIFVGQDFGYRTTQIVGAQIVYIKKWSEGYDEPGSAAYNGKQDQILSIASDGSGKQVLKNISIPAIATYEDISALVYNPAHVYFQVSNSSGNTYYDYTNGSVTQSNTITDESWQQDQQNYATYLQSPSGNQTFWSQTRDGKNTLFVGDANGANGKQIASLSDYTAYGWYGENYVLVEKGSNELYVMPASGGKALKVSDYYKPSTSLSGYGSGYGGGR